MITWKNDLLIKISDAYNGSANDYRLAWAIKTILDHLPDEELEHADPPIKLKDIEQWKPEDYIEVNDIVRWCDKDCIIQGMVVCRSKYTCKIQTYSNGSNCALRLINECILIRKGKVTE